MHDKLEKDYTECRIRCETNEQGKGEERVADSPKGFPDEGVVKGKLATPTRPSNYMH